ncbi:MAG: glycosyl hydrolase, partial [Lacunisphaera sp.]
MKTSRVLWSSLLCCVAFAAGGVRGADSSDLAWPVVTRENKPWTRWWWLGSAVDQPNLTRELDALSAAGFGGVEITPIYGAKGYEDRFINFLSPKYLEMLGFVGTEAKRLNLGVDMATGTGWPFGGPEVGPQ